MRTIAIHILTLTIAIVAVVFAVWPVVGDAPWEEEVTRIERIGEKQVPVTRDQLCQSALEGDNSYSVVYQLCRDHLR